MSRLTRLALCSCALFTTLAFGQAPTSCETSTPRVELR
jgi:hypothetical protein